MGYEVHIILDLEFNPSAKENRDLLRQEIIEIGAVKLNAQMEEIGRFSCFVKPELNRVVDASIVRLTGIRTEDVMNARPFEEALRLFSEWVGPGRARICSWSDNDLRQVLDECYIKDVPFPENFGHWMDLQKVYQYIIRYPLSRSLALHRAAELLGVSFSSRLAHRAMYDTEVTAEIYRIMCSDGFVARQRAAETAVVTNKTHTTFSVGAECAEALAALLSSFTAA